MSQRLTKDGDPHRDVWQQERRVELTPDGQWNRAVAIDVDGFADCADFAIRYPQGWAIVVSWRVLLRIGTTLFETGTGTLLPTGPGILQLGTDLSTLVLKVRGIPHDGLIVELRLPVAAGAGGVATVHGKSWARSPADLSVGQVNVQIPQPLIVTGSVGIDGQPIEVYGTVNVAEPVTVDGAVSILGQPIKVYGTVQADPPVPFLDRFDPPALPARIVRATGLATLVVGFSIYNPTTQPIFFMVWDSGTLPGAIPSNTAPIRVAPGTNVSIEYPPMRHVNGLTWGASSVATVYTNLPGPNQPILLVDSFWR